MNASTQLCRKYSVMHVSSVLLAAVMLFLCMMLTAAVYAESYLDTIPPEMLKEELLQDAAREGMLERIRTSISLAAAGATQTVAIIVDNPVFADIAPQITQYIADVESRFPVELLLCTEESWREQSHTNVRQYLQALYADHDISGAILVGFYPYMHWEMGGANADFPLMLNNMDLDGEFLDTDNDGKYDCHIWGENGMEIWVSLIWPYQVSKTSTEYTGTIIQQLQDYFDKTHKYYTKQLVIPHRAFVYANNNWNASDATREHCYRIFGTNGYDEINRKSFEIWGNGQEYINKRAGGYEFLNIWCHSGAQNHYFDQGPHRMLPSSNIDARLSKGSVISFLYNCHGSDFYAYPQGCFGQRYSFEGIGQASIGNTRSIGVVGQADMVDALSYGAYLGEVFYEVLNAQYESVQGFNYTSNNLMYGQTLMGNPFLYMNASNTMSAAYGSVSGQVLRYNNIPITNAKVTVTCDGAVKNIVYTDESGRYFADYIGPGDLTIYAYDLDGMQTEPQSLTLAEGEAASDVILRIQNIFRLEENGWRYKAQLMNLSELPGDWNTRDCDTSSWETGQPPYLRNYEGRGTALDFAKYICLRRNFILDERAEKTIINISSDTGIELYVNGTKVPVHTILATEYTRTNCNYWNYCYDITDHTVTGENYVVIRSWAVYRAPPAGFPPTYLDAKVCTVLPTNMPPALNVTPQAIYLNTYFTEGSFAICNEGTGTFSYTITVPDHPDWLEIDTAAGTVCSNAKIPVAINMTHAPVDIKQAAVQIQAGDAGSKTVQITFIPEEVLYETHFDEPIYTNGCDLNGLDYWIPGSAYDNACIIEDPTAPDGDGQCLYIDFAFHYWRKIEREGYPLLRYSGYFNLLPNGSNEMYGIEFRMGYSDMMAVRADKQQGCCYLAMKNRNGDVIKLYDYSAKTGEWVYASYLIEVCGENNFIREAQIGTVTTNMPDFESFYPYEVTWVDLKVYTPGFTNVAVKVDDLRITAIPEPIVGSMLVFAIGLFLVKRKMNY